MHWILGGALGLVLIAITHYLLLPLSGDRLIGMGILMTTLGTFGAAIGIYRRTLLVGYVRKNVRYTNQSWVTESRDNELAAILIQVMDGKQREHRRLPGSLRLRMAPLLGLLIGGLGMIIVSATHMGIFLRGIDLGA